MCMFLIGTLKGDILLAINSWGMKLLRNIDKPFAAVPNDTTKPYSIGSLNLLTYNIYQSLSDTPHVSLSFPILHWYSHT